VGDKGLDAGPSGTGKDRPRGLGVDEELRRPSCGELLAFGCSGGRDKRAPRLEGGRAPLRLPSFDLACTASPAPARAESRGAAAAIVLS